VRGTPTANSMSYIMIIITPAMINCCNFIISIQPDGIKINALKVIPQFCIALFYCAHLITYNFIHYTYHLKKIKKFMTILCYFKTFLVTFVQRITLKSMFSKKAYKSVARVPCVCSISIHLYFTF
jgi:hypothetical protein